MMTEKQDDIYIQALLDGLAPKSDSLAEAIALCGFDAGSDNEFQHLYSIVGRVGGEENQINRTFLPQLLSLGPQSIFAQAEQQGDTQRWKEETLSELGKLNASIQNSSGYRYSLYHFLHAYGARVAYGKAGQVLDASWFDRNRVLAAVASCLSRNGGKEEFLILKGAISGIQKYIYHNIKAEQIGDAVKASKKLRGRSFLVAFINQVIAESLVEELGLEQANILFVGGGHFTLLLPNKDELTGKLNALLKKINLGLLDEVGPQLSLLTAWVACEGNIGQNFAENYKKVHRKLEASKQRRYHAYLTEVFEHFEKLEDLQNTRQEKEEIRLGQLAPYARYILEVGGSEEALENLANKVPKANKPAIAALSFLGKHFYVVKEEELVENEDDQELKNELRQFLETHKEGLEALDHLKVIALNNPNVLETVEAFSGLGLDIGYGFRFVGNYAPIYKEAFKYDYPAENGNVMLFEDLAKLDKDKEPTLTHDQLGVMRLDVDDLGVIFAHGLGKKEENTMERLLSLSREFQLFFGGYFNKLAEHHHLYVTYSGGDDAFVIGSWLNTIHFADTLNKEFQQFTCGNSQVSFSAGIFICNPHYPIPRLAKDGEKVEKAAKQYPAEEKKKEDKAKNALHLFQHTLPWADFQKMIAFEEKLSQVLPKGESAEGRKIRRSMLRRFLRIIQSSRGQTFERYRAVASLHGLLARHGYGQGEMQKAVLDEAGELIKELLQKASNEQEEGQKEFDHYTIPLHIALYKTKSK